MSCVIGTRIDGVPHFNFTVTAQDIDKMAKVMIKHIEKDWDVETLSRKEFSGGISNNLVGYFTEGNNKNGPKYHEKDRSHIILTRIYGEKTELIINREQELQNIKELSRENIAPPIYCTFLNGYCYGFVEGTVCIPENFTDKNILSRSAQLMAKLHTMKLSQSYTTNYKMEPTVFERIKQYINLMPKKFNTPKQQEQYANGVPSPDKLHAEVETLEHAVSSLNNMVVTFTHNDLLVANYIFNASADELRCIDFEYGSPNYSAYDIGNHFNEFCGIDEVDYNLYPSKETQMLYLRTYLETINELKGSKASVSDEDVAEWYINVEHMSLASHLFWGVWAQIQAYYSSIDFDFLGYGIIRLDEYFRRKKQVLG